jgi:hypothetical protein
MKNSHLQFQIGILIAIMNEKELLENILTADILILSHLMDAKKRANGTQRMGGNFTTEAIQEIKSSRADLIHRLISN